MLACIARNLLDDLPLRTVHAWRGQQQPCHLVCAAVEIPLLVSSQVLAAPIAARTQQACLQRIAWSLLRLLFHRSAPRRSLRLRSARRRSRSSPESRESSEASIRLTRRRANERGQLTSSPRAPRGLRRRSP